MGGNPNKVTSSEYLPAPTGGIGVDYLERDYEAAARPSGLGNTRPYFSVREDEEPLMAAQNKSLAQINKSKGGNASK
jgi:hypothetical protein